MANYTITHYSMYIRRRTTEEPPGGPLGAPWDQPCWQLLRWSRGAMQVWLEVLAGAQGAAAALVQRGDAGVVGSASWCARGSCCAGPAGRCRCGWKCWLVRRKEPPGGLLGAPWDQPCWQLLR
jgi:hypothetical protein